MITIPSAIASLLPFRLGLIKSGPLTNRRKARIETRAERIIIMPARRIVPIVAELHDCNDRAHMFSQLGKANVAGEPLEIFVFPASGCK